jgi:uncharacterized protein (DUF1778 family)|uniref:Alginate and motility regulator n=1 Tax=Ackermannviridae sp. TaxID=2831612 RepID=A0A8S5RUI8_9CAUD|nr:MAG TPA: Alginate and motility regulator [Ackermannviridae sp.]
MGGKTSTESKRKYNDKTYSRIVLDVKKDDKALIVQAAEKAGESTTAYIVGAVRQRMEADNQKTTV